MKMYSLYDRVSLAFYAPFCSANDGAASRSVGTAAHMDNTIVSQHPDDFDLYSIADFDESTGIVAPLAIPLLIAKVSALIPHE